MAGSAQRAIRPGGVVRRTEFDKLRGLLQDLGPANGAAVALVGEPGIGKTRLIAALSAEARASGTPVLTSSGRRGSDLPSVLERLAQVGCALVTVDDLHLIDIHQSPLIAELIHRTTTAPVLVVLAYRDRQMPRQLAAMLSRAGVTDLLDQWRLAPLVLAQARDLLGDRPDLSQLHYEGAGNPLYLEMLAARGTDSLAGARTALLGELAELADRELRVAQAAAVLQDPFLVEPVATVAELSIAQTLAVLDTLASLDLIRSVAPPALFAFRHPVVRELVYDQLEPSRRIAAHLRVDAELSSRGASIRQRAHHIARAAGTSRPEHVTILLAAAREVTYTAPATAAEWLETVLRLTHEGDDRWFEAQALLARAQLLCGRRTDVRDLVHTLLPQAARIAGGDLLSLLALAARAGRIDGRYAEADALIRDGLAVLAEAHPRTAEILHTELADLALDRLDQVGARWHAQAAVKIARTRHDRLGEAVALVQACSAHMLAMDAAAAESAASVAADLVDAAPDATVITNLPGLYLVGSTEAALDRLNDGERHLTRCVTLARRTGQNLVLPAALTVLGAVELRLGRLPRAEETLEQAQELLVRDSAAPTPVMIALLRATTLLWRNSADDTDEPLIMAERAASLAQTLIPDRAVLARCRYAELLFHAGESRRGQRLLLHAVGGPDMPRFPVWRRSRWYELLTCAAVGSGEIEAAAYWTKLAEGAETGAPSGQRGFAQRARMRLHAARGETDGAVSSAEQAVESFTELGLALELGQTLLAAGTMLIDGDRPQVARGWLNRAASLAEQCGSGRLANQVRDQRNRLSSHPRPDNPLSILTDREREIAELVSSGMTSVEIARRLFLSVRTVDTHLGRIYRKLGLQNRASLTRAVLTPGGPDRQQTRFPGGD